MTVEGLGRPGAAQPEPRRTDATTRGPAVTAAPPSGETPRVEAPAIDSVQLSPEAVALATAEVPKQTMEPIRLREITAKIAGGEYESPPTLEILTDRLLAVLRGGT